MISESVSSLFDFIKNSPTGFHTIASIKSILSNEGYVQLHEEEGWHLTSNGKYFVIRNQSSIVAFHIGNELDGYSFQIVASHSDSPCFKVKENAQIAVGDAYTQLNTEGYGGMLCATWLDRPLSLAGRLLIKEDRQLISKLIHIDRDLVLIPNLAIHYNRRANEGIAYNKQIDMLPLFGSKLDKNTYYQLLAKEAGVDADAVYGADIFVYNRSEPSVWGAKQEYFSAPRLDDLECVYTTLQGFIKGYHPQTIQVYACFDNEEVGSMSKQGAASTFLSDVLHRINENLGKTNEDYHRALASGFMVSADNAQALPPSHPEKADVHNHVLMNHGIVLKANAAQHYTSDAISIALFKRICEQAKVPWQSFVNRSDEAGGGTLGNIAQTHVSLHTIDIGLAQLAMHSAYETAGVNDVDAMISAMTEFFSSRIRQIETERFEVIR